MDKGLRVLSLFDGISCGMVALERLGVKVGRYVAYEIDNDAIKISKKNYDMIEHKGNVFNAKYNQGEFDLLIGGSPCTYWSVARTDGKRETTSSGIGFDLFMQYVRALREAKPKYFLYENNFSISKEIKREISKYLGVKYIVINSSLVSGQNRKRCYWTNIPVATLPRDKKIKLYDVVDFSTHTFKPLGKWVWTYRGEKQKIDELKNVKSNKSHTLTTSKTHSMGYYLSEDKKSYCNLTVRDFEVLQTLPIGYVDNVPVKETSKYKAIGNGWTVDVIVHILSFIPDIYMTKNKILIFVGGIIQIKDKFNANVKWLYCGKVNNKRLLYCVKTKEYRVVDNDFVREQIGKLKSGVMVVKQTREQVEFHKNVAKRMKRRWIEWLKG